MKTIELDKSNHKLKCRGYSKIPEKPNAAVTGLAAPHIDSFNFFLEDGLQAAVRNLSPVEFSIPNGDKISVFIQDAEVGMPTIKPTLGDTVDLKLYPKECIEKGESYRGSLAATVGFKINERMGAPLTCNLGEIPIMVKSNKCNLHGMNPAELVKHGELVNETGGYFIINGTCRILRLLIANRRNYPVALIRKSWKMRDTNFSEKGILMRCVREDETSSINILHHLVTGGVKLEFQLNKAVFFIPLIMALKALLDYSDRLIYQFLMRGREKDEYFSEKVKMMMRELQENKLSNREMCKDYIGETFRVKLNNIIPIWKSNEEVCDFLFEKHVMIHLESPKEKFETLCMMTRKLFALIGGDCVAESVDVVSMQEASLGGHTFLQLVKEKLFETLVSVKFYILAKTKKEGELFQITDGVMSVAVNSGKKMGDTLSSFIATGTLPSRSGCGLMQTTGLTVVLEHLNRMRDLSHLRAIHRGAYFITMKTIGPRRLTGEAWGFICPVHTPDGAPCGLLNHLAFHCVISSEPPDALCLTRALLELGMTPVEAEPVVPFHRCLEVVLDGCLVGYVEKKRAKEFELQLRALKVAQKIYGYTEIVLIEERVPGGQYAALFLATSVSRMMRPVVNLRLGCTEFVGTFEQIYLNVAVSPEDIEEGVHTHMEIEKTSMLSNIAKLVPFSDCNPNPRNMYQCQMGKQTMGTPVHNWRNQTASKLYRLQSPQLPLVRNSHYDTIDMPDFCMGFNAVLAIVSYTGYDMEDAMVINKCAMERGLAHGQVYKSEFLDLRPGGRGHLKAKNEVTHVFRRDPSDPDLSAFLDETGLPFPGTKLTNGDPYVCMLDVNQRTYRVTKYKGEDCVVDKYSIINTDGVKQSPIQRVNITIRIRRDPIIGDKFASRSGQKGIMSRLYPMEDLPFSERGIVPDIIFNPHGIPSRMTAGTLIDLVAGKCAAEFGKAFDSTPFEFSDENPAYDYYGQILEKAGFNYFGEDVLYSGTDGRMMEVEVFEGVVYYQRLRHMTADKWQVRSTGPNAALTQQPIKGRKRGGAIRFGEMERDCLISHGAAYMLQDRLLNCSDLSKEWVCSKCGSVLSPLTIAGNNKYQTRSQECSVCGPDAELRQINLPYAFKYLVAELASVGIKSVLGLTKAEDIMRTQSYPHVKVKEES